MRSLESRAASCAWISKRAHTPPARRLYILVTKTANEASAALTLNEQLVAMLTTHMADRQARLELEASAR